VYRGAYHLIPELIAPPGYINPRGSTMRMHYKKAPYTLRIVLAFSAIVWIIVVASYPLIQKVSGHPQPLTQISGGQGSMTGSPPTPRGGGDGNVGGSVIDIYRPSELAILNNLSGYNLIYFEQRDCPGCKEVSPAIERYFSTDNSLGISLIRIHIDDIFNLDQDAALRLVTAYAVPGTPTLIMVRDGVEIARQVGIFRGDQYEGLKAFMEKAIGGGGNSSGPIIGPLSSLGLGFLAAVSPCSLPMLVLFASSASVGKSLGRAVKLFATLAAILAPASLGISLASSLGRPLGVSVYYAVVTYIATVSLIWGILTLAGREPLLHVGRRSALVLPVLGMQCSFPFLLAVISMMPRDLALAIASSLAFSAGYIAPYLGSTLFVSAARDAVSSHRWGHVMKYVQGIILASVGIYVLAAGVPYVLG